MGLANAFYCPILVYSILKSGEIQLYGDITILMLQTPYHHLHSKYATHLSTQLLFSDKARTYKREEDHNNHEPEPNIGSLSITAPDDLSCLGIKFIGVLKALSHSVNYSIDVLVATKRSSKPGSKI